MPSILQPVPALARLFRRSKIADINRLRAALGTSSRMTVFRKLSAAGYYSSCSHCGRYYTLAHIPDFDSAGLWRYQGVVFSRDGTLKDTVARLVCTSEDGQLHQELEDLLGLRVHNSLADLVRCGRVDRDLFRGVFLYVNPDRARAEIQKACRAHRITATIEADEDLTPSVVIEVLVEVVHGSVVRLDAAQVHARLAARGVMVTVHEVERILQRYGVEKKTALSRSRRSRH